MPFLVSSYSIIGLETVSGRVFGVTFKSPGKAIFANPEGSQFRQSGRVLFLPIQKGPSFF